MDDFEHNNATAFKKREFEEITRLRRAREFEEPYEE